MHADMTRPLATFQPPSKRARPPLVYNVVYVTLMPFTGTGFHAEMIAGVAEALASPPAIAVFAGAIIERHMELPGRHYGSASLIDAAAAPQEYFSAARQATPALPLIFASDTGEVTATFDYCC